MKKVVISLIVISQFILVSSNVFAGTKYVDTTASGANNGSSWTDAFNKLQDPLTSATSSDDIYVAAGTYYPSMEVGGTGDRYKTFQMKNGVAIYGGFPTGGSDFANRDPNQYETILSGDIGVTDDDSDNCYHVFYHSEGINLDATAILDGFTITAGSSGGSESQGWGGGMYNYASSPTIANCIFSDNLAEYVGGGMYNNRSNPMVTNCIFSGNSGPNSGGGMHNYRGSPTVTNCSFIDNNGDGMSNQQSSPTVTGCLFTNNNGDGMENSSNCNPTVINCTFTGNSAFNRTGRGMRNSDNSSPTVTDCSFANNDGGMTNSSNSSPTVSNCIFTGNFGNTGGGMHNRQSSNPIVTNCTFTDNSAASFGGGIYNDQSASPIVTNCIIWGNTADRGNEIALYFSSTIDIGHCDIQGGQTGIYNHDPSNTINWGIGNIVKDPLFVDSENDDLHLLPESPCIDAGDNSLVDPNSTDLDGNPRIIDGDGDGEVIVDMGAYEYFIPNTAPAADAGEDVTVSADQDCGAVVILDGSGSSDADGDELTYYWYYEGELFGEGVEVKAELDLGLHEFTLIVNDGTEDSEPDEVVVTVVDNTPPEFGVVMEPGELWPPNHRMVEVTPIFEVSDNCSSDIAIELIDITCDEDDENDYGTEGGVYLRAERDGYGDGRVYILTYRAEDESGNISLGRAEVFVPHDQGQHYQGKPGDRNNDLFINYLDFAELRIQTEAAPSSDSDLLEALVLLAENWLE